MTDSAWRIDVDRDIAGNVTRVASEPASAIGPLVALLNDLALAGIPHCLWKSNLHLEAALAGETDLDLLVARDAASGFRAIAARHGLMAVVPPPSATYPAMEHLLGMDRASGRMFHLHVHYQLVLGERFVKNHRLPLEAEFLASTRELHGVPIPRADLDLAVLAVRALLKYRVRDVVKDVLGIRTPGIPIEIQQEIAWLQADAHPSSLEHRPVPDGLRSAAAIVVDFLEVVSQRPRSGVELFRLRGQLRRVLRRQQRQRRLAATAEYLKILVRRRRRFVRRRHEPRMTPATGGLVVAVIGADGSGKTTVSTAVREWLDWKLDARVLYMGSKQPSRLTSGSYLVFRALRRATRAAVARGDDEEGDGERGAVARSAALLRDAAFAAHHLSVARDRAARYREGLRAASQGSIVLFDRFPVEGFSGDPDHRVLDGPQLRAAFPAAVPRLLRPLVNVEERAYRRYSPPDLLVVLLADPVVAAARKPDHDITTIARKWRAAVEVADAAEARGVSVRRVDAGAPLDEVLRNVKVGLWDAI